MSFSRPVSGSDHRRGRPATQRGLCVPGAAAFSPAQDPSGLPACCTDVGGAHCLPADAIDPDATGRLAACDDASYCVPDVWIEAGGGAALVECASIGGAEGVCLSLCIPLVAENGDLLPQDVCAADEKCAPCISALDGQPTGAFEIDLSCEPGDDDGSDGEGSDDGIGGLGGNPEGACMHDCLANADIFFQDGCADGFKCVACELPILGETGACDFLPGG